VDNENLSSSFSLSSPCISEGESLAVNAEAGGKVLYTLDRTPKLVFAFPEEGPYQMLMLFPYKEHFPLSITAEQLSQTISWTMTVVDEI
jgi:hypothetical protein